MQYLNFDKLIFKTIVGTFLMLNVSFLNCFSNSKFLVGLSDLYAIDNSMKIYKCIERNAKKVGLKHNLYPVASGLGTNKKKQDVINVGFDNDSKPLLINEAREKLIPCFQDFLSEVNRDQKLLKIFSSRPITEENINFSIINYTENHKYDLLDPFICAMAVNKGIVSFYTVRPNLKPRYHGVDETYEEALEKLQKQKTKNDLHESSNNLSQEK